MLVEVNSVVGLLQTCES